MLPTGYTCTVFGLSYSPLMSQSRKCHPTRAKGFQRIEAMVTPERKAEFKTYCRQHGTTQARLLNTFLTQLLGPESDSK